MKIEQVADGVFRAEGSHTNFALVVDGADVTIIDSGYPKDRDLVDAAVTQIGRTLADVHALVLTHAHVDHKGSAERLRRDHAVPVHCHTDEVRLARGEITQQISLWELRKAWRPNVFRFALNAIRRGGLNPEHVTEVTTYVDQETLDVPGHPVAIFTPGHTQGHCSIHLPDRGVLVTGDALVTIDLWNPKRVGPQVVRREFNHDHAQTIASLDRLAGLEADVLLPGHGKVWRGAPSMAVALAQQTG
jgi:glyoxylase-like metal-dependent hydrolase (beta-lactamase superfamily II)